DARGFGDGRRRSPRGSAFSLGLSERSSTFATRRGALVPPSRVDAGAGRRPERGRGFTQTDGGRNRPGAPRANPAASRSGGGRALIRPAATLGKDNCFRLM